MLSKEQKLKNDLIPLFEHGHLNESSMKSNSCISRIMHLCLCLSGFMNEHARYLFHDSINVQATQTTDTCQSHLHPVYRVLVEL